MAGTQEMGKTPSGHDVRRANRELVIVDGRYFLIYLMVIDDYSGKFATSDFDRAQRRGPRHGLVAGRVVVQQFFHAAEHVGQHVGFGQVGDAEMRVV